jgi:hypothetical protein
MPAAEPGEAEAAHEHGDKTAPSCSTTQAIDASNAEAKLSRFIIEAMVLSSRSAAAVIRAADENILIAIATRLTDF